jgi:ubiquinone/menaquinone biosynthesis C-methylase UbiE
MTERDDSTDATGRVRRIWDRFAPRYDKDMRLCDRLLFPGGREWVCSQAAGETLEVAIGTGLNLPFYPATATLTGVDLSPVMLALAAERAVHLGRELALREADAAGLPFDDASFDSVVCTLGLCTIPDERGAVEEMYRVLRPGGRLLLLDHVAAPNPLLRAGQRLLEAATIRSTADHQTRHPLTLVRRTGFQVEAQRRSRAGTVERVRAVRPPAPAPAG